MVQAQSTDLSFAALRLMDASGNRMISAFCKHLPPAVAEPLDERMAAGVLHDYVCRHPECDAAITLYDGVVYLHGFMLDRVRTVPVCDWQTCSRGHVTQYQGTDDGFLRMPRGRLFHRVLLENMLMAVTAGG